MPAILTGVRVLEFAHMVAGPACGQILSDLGADVTKVEPPSGDITRTLGPRWNGTSALFASTNRGKTSLCADLRDPVAVRELRGLVLDMDVVVCNIDRSMMVRAGLDAKTLRAANERLIYVEISGFGADGPSGTDGLAQAATGLMNITGEENGPSYRTGASIVDVSTGVWGALGVLVALERRRLEGRGDHVQASLADVCTFLQYSQLAMYVAEPSLIRRLGNHSAVSCTPTFAARDGRVIVTILHNRHWEAFCTVAGVDLVADPRFATNELRCAAQSELERLLEPVFARRTRGEWVEALRGVHIPCGPERNYAEVVADPEFRRRGLLYDIPVAGQSTLQVRLPLEFEETELVPPRAAPDLGNQITPAVRPH